MKAVQMISGLLGGSYEEKLVELGIQSLEGRREESDMVQTHKIVHGLDEVKRGQWFELEANRGTSGVRTRHQQGVLNLRPAYGRTEVRRNFFSVRVVPKWNALPDKIKMSATTHSFKHQYRKYIEGTS